MTQWLEIPDGSLIKNFIPPNDRWKVVIFFWNFITLTQQKCDTFNCVLCSSNISIKRQNPVSPTCFTFGFPRACKPVELHRIRISYGIVVSWQRRTTCATYANESPLNFSEEQKLAGTVLRNQNDKRCGRWRGVTRKDNIVVDQLPRQYRSCVFSFRVSWISSPSTIDGINETRLRWGRNEEVVTGQMTNVYI